jgi:hypothetical protein
LSRGRSEILHEGQTSEVAMSDQDERLRYRVLTGPDDRAFCERISKALAEGYRLHGGPAVAFNGERVIVAQAIVLDGAPDAVVRPV